MARAIQGRNGGTLYVSEKGETSNPHGRPKKLGFIDYGRKILEGNGEIEVEVDEVIEKNGKKFAIIKLCNNEAMAMMLIKAAQKSLKTGKDPAFYEIFHKAFVGYKTDIPEPIQPILVQVNIDNSKDLLINHKIE